jgi:hypothetical protein
MTNYDDFEKESFEEDEFEDSFDFEEENYDIAPEDTIIKVRIDSLIRDKSKNVFQKAKNGKRYALVNLIPVHDEDQWILDITEIIFWPSSNKKDKDTKRDIKKLKSIAVCFGCNLKGFRIEDLIDKEGFVQLGVRKNKQGEEVNFCSKFINETDEYM